MRMKLKNLFTERSSITRRTRMLDPPFTTSLQPGYVEGQEAESGLMDMLVIPLVHFRPHAPPRASFKPDVLPHISER